MFFVLSSNFLLFPSASLNISRSEFALVQVLETTHHYDWYQIICDDLKLKAEKFRCDPCKKTTARTILGWVLFYSKFFIVFYSGLYRFCLNTQDIFLPFWCWQNRFPYVTRFFVFIFYYLFLLVYYLDNLQSGIALLGPTPLWDVFTQIIIKLVDLAKSTDIDGKNYANLPVSRQL